jgi:hypothetical protein
MYDIFDLRGVFVLVQFRTAKRKIVPHSVGTFPLIFNRWYGNFVVVRGKRKTEEKEKEGGIE